MPPRPTPGATGTALGQQNLNFAGAGLSMSRYDDANCKLAACQGDGFCPDIIKPITGHNIAPFVVCHFIDGDFCVTVGNESSYAASKNGLCGGISGLTAAKNHAIISNFQYGASGGSVAGSDGITVEITDEEGGDFCNFMINVLPKNRDKAQPAANMNCLFQFGWITTGCNDASGQCTITSQIRKCFPLKVDIAFQGGGIIKFSIHAPNPTEVLAEGVNTELKVRGDQKANKKCLQPAIKEMFQEYGMVAQFYKPRGKSCQGGGGGGQNSSGGVGTAAGTSGMCKFLIEGPSRRASYDTWKFEEPGPCPDKGPENAWAPNSKDPVQAAMHWMQDYKTEAKKGIVPGTSNDADQPPTVIFWESPLPECNGASNMVNIGTFIVNGGKCSPVLEFKPQIQWFMANLNQGGTVGSPTSADSIAVIGSGGNDPRAVSFKQITCDVSGQGTNERQPMPETRGDVSPTTGVDKTAEAHAAHARALPPMEPVKAELVVQGLPELDDPMALSAGVECGICVINPFIIQKRMNGKCGDWLADPPVNRFLSNAHWLINGVSHQIKEGSFTTTLHCWLATPGVTIDKSAQLGGPGGPSLKKT